MGALISYPDWTTTATLSGGSWNASFPLANLQDWIMSHVARSTDALAASSTILVNLTAARDIRLISLCAHNMSIDATVRVRGYEDAARTVLLVDTGAILAWPNGFTADMVADYPKNWTYCFFETVNARYWTIEIIDTTNAAGYIELGRCWLGDSFSPVVGVSYGMSLGYESRDVIEESLGGIPWGSKRTPRRTLTATFGTLSGAEKRAALILQKVLTETNEAYWVSDTLASPEDMLLEAFPCFLRKPSALTYPYFDNSEMTITIIEKL